MTGYIENGTVFIPFNGHRKIIESPENQHVLSSLKKEGWTVPEPTVAMRDYDNPQKDYLTCLVYKSF